MLPRVLFVSKPIGPPWTDGSKCLVRDIAANLHLTQGAVMTTAAMASDALPAGVIAHQVYKHRGGFAPALQDNARVLLHLLFNRQAQLWHFVMAPNARTCSVAKALRRVRHVPVVQTIASQPRSFSQIDALMFGDVVVAQSHWTRDAVLSASAEHRHFEMEVIPPPVGAVPEPHPTAIARVRQQLEVSETAPLFVYPGDLEVSQGAYITAELVEPLVRAVPDAVVVFACREKTPHAIKARTELQAKLIGAPVRFVGEVADFGALLKTARAVIFPVDDLYGKVDLPIALLEAMVLGVPVLALAYGPLLDLRGGATLIDPGDLEGWAAVCARLSQDPGWRRETSERGRAFVATHHDAVKVAGSYERIYQRLLAGPESPGRGAKA